MYILLLVLLIGANAFFAMTEIAVLSTNMKKMKKKADTDKRARILLQISEVPEKFLATIQVGVTLSGFLASAVAADNFVSILLPYLGFLPVSQQVLEGLLLLVITIVLAYFTLIFGELVPKRVAMRNPEKISLKVASFVWFFYSFSKPFVAILAGSTNLVLKMLGMDQEVEEESVTEEEVMMLVEEGEEQGNIEVEEHQMIKNIFALDSKPVVELMTHRLDMVAIHEEMTLEEVLNVIVESGYSRLPVYSKDIDHIVGVIYAKDLLHLVGKTTTDGMCLNKYLHQPIYTHEWKLCDDLLKDMKNKKVHIAIVIDEYGGTSGMVTLEDLIEVIVGDIHDEYDDEEETTTIGEGIYILDGSMALEDVEEVIGQEINENEYYDSLGGLVIATLDRIPQQGERITGTIDNYTLEVLKVKGQKIEKIKLCAHT